MSLESALEAEQDRPVLAPPLITEQQIRRTMRLSVLEGVPGICFIVGTSGSVITGFALSLGSGARAAAGQPARELGRNADRRVHGQFRDLQPADGSYWRRERGLRPVPRGSRGSGHWQPRVVPICTLTSTIFFAEKTIDPRVLATLEYL
jgi:hypothetical protein